MKPFWWVILSLFLSSAAAQEKCVIEGTVVDGVTGEPLKKASLLLMSTGGNQVNGARYGATSDEAGRYRIENIAPGSYSFTAVRNGYVRSWYGSKANRAFSPGIPLTLSAGEVLKAMAFRLMPQAVIAGRVVDEDGERLPEVHIQCVRAGFVNGKKTLLPAVFASTNDKGEYRAFGLAPGKYYVSATYRLNGNYGTAEIRNDEAANDSYATTYYPSAFTEANAIPVNVTSGAEITGIDLKMIRMRAVQVSGTVAGAANVSRIINVMLVPKGNGGLVGWDRSRQVVTDPKGAFLFRGVLPGKYLLQTDISTNDQTQMTATANIEVGGSNIENVQLAFVASPPLTGRVVIEGKQDVADWKGRQINILLEPEGGEFGSGYRGNQMKDDGTFEIANPSTERYRVRVSGMPESCYLKAIRAGAAEVPNHILDLSKGSTAGELTIVVSPNAAVIEGSVQDKDQKPTSGARVVAFPDARDFLLRYAMASTDQNGRFVMKGLAAGKYKLFAFDELDWGAQDDPEFVKPFEDRGEAIELKDGARAMHDLKLIVTDEPAAARK